MVYVALELVRLGYECHIMQGEDWERLRKGLSRGEGLAGHLSRISSDETKGELELREEKIAEERERERWGRWWRGLGANLAYAPMTVHYSTEGGVGLGEGVLGGLGCLVGLMNFPRVWRESA